MKFQGMKGKSCVVCGSMPVDACHVRSKGAGGTDQEINLIPMCRKHHRMQHDMGWPRFWSAYESASEYLRAKGWELTDSVGILKLYHPEMRGDG